MYNGTKYISTIDLSDAYYQIRIAKVSRGCTAFSVSSKGTFQYKRMANGLTNASASLCELIQNIIGSDLEPKVFPYMDDFLILTETFDEHIAVIKEVAKRLNSANLTISATKCYFCMKRTSYVGYTISENGIEPNPERIKPILDMPSPSSLKSVRRLIGMAGWYRRFIPKFAEITAPITETLKKENFPFQWNEKAQDAFEKLKAILTTEPILQSPDFSKPFVLHTDASDTGVGGILTQNINDNERVIAFFSTKLNSAQRNYTTTERECLAVLLAIEKFRPYLDGVKFTVYTDHASLVWLQNMKEPTSRLARWALRLACYDFELFHRKGKDMVVPDCLSRLNCEIIDLEDFRNTKDENYWQTFKATQQGIAMDAENNFYTIENELLYKKVLGRNGSAWKLYVPADYVEMILKDCHDNLTAGHFGTFKTLRRIQENYFWPSMSNDVYHYVTACEQCQASKSSNKRKTNLMGNFRNAAYPWRTIAIDFVGPLVKSKLGNTCMLTVVDQFTKYGLTFPLRHATAELTINRLTNKVFSYFGVPQYIICDNGTQFKSQIFQQMAESRCIEIMYCASYHPQANPAEAFNKILGTALKLYVDQNQHNTWDENLDEIMCAINTSTHSQTQSSPYELLFGHTYIGNGQMHKLLADTNDRSQVEIEDKLSVIWQQAREALKKSHEKAKRYHDKNAREINFDIGDVVWKRNTVLSNKANKVMSKLNPRGIKCIVQGKPAHNMYSLIDFNTKKPLGNFASNELQKGRDNLRSQK